jgi:type IV/VI secretion system ImpK/VasF family protein
MSGNRRPWTHIAEVCGDIQRLCQEAQAVELRAQEARQARASPPMPGAPPVAAAPVTGADIVGLRAELRSRLVKLKAKLSESLTEREVYYALFPLVVYADELAQSATRGRSAAWPPLQRELYELENGGEAFYSSADLLLSREETSPLVFEVFYLCLSAGFLGQYANAPEKIEAYKARLAARIPVTHPRERNDHAVQPSVELVRFPTWYYVVAVAVVVGMFAALHLVSYFEA